MGTDPLGLGERSKYQATVDLGAEIMRRRAEECRADPASEACHGVLAILVSQVFGDDPGGTDSPRLLPQVGPKGSNPVLFVNGILTDEFGATRYAKEMARWLDRPVLPIWNPTSGSMLKDSAQTALIDKSDITDPTTRLVVQALRSQLQELSSGERLTIVGHSQGGAIVSSAVGFLDPDQRARVDVITIGGAACGFPEGVGSVRTEINSRDIVPMLFGAGDPSCARRLEGSSNVEVNYRAFGVVGNFELTHGVDVYRAAAGTQPAASGPLDAELQKFRAEVRKLKREMNEARDYFRRLKALQ